MKPTLEEIKDNYERVLLRLSNGELAGVVHDIRFVELQVVRKTNWKSLEKMYTIDLSDGYERNSCLGEYDIDAIAFMNDADEVDYYINNYDPKDIYWDWDINNPQCDDHMDAYNYAISTRTDWADILLERNLINEKGDNNNMMNEILEIYEDKQLSKINKKYDDLEQLIKQTDERYKVWLECTTTLDKLYAEDKICNFAHTPINLSEDTKKKLRTIVYDKREEELRKFHSKKAEVNAQLSMCETYDQKQEILRRYNIINKNGKVNG